MAHRADNWTPESAAEPVFVAEDVRAVVFEQAESDETLAVEVEHGDDWFEALVESPIDLEDDGSEPNVTLGHEVEELGYGLDAIEPDTFCAEEVECVSCGRVPVSVRTCGGCGQPVCAVCATVRTQQAWCVSCVVGARVQ